VTVEPKETMIRGADFKVGDAINVWTVHRPHLITAIRRVDA
jgi:hypothetical protein